MHKNIRSQRAAFIFDRGFIVGALKIGNDFNLKQEIEIGPHKKRRGSKQQGVK
jgi:hypothetical protein